LALGAAARFLLHLVRINGAFQVRHGLEGRARCAVGLDADLGESSEQLVRASSSQRDNLTAKGKVASVRRDVHIAGPTGDFPGRDWDCLSGRKAESGLAVEKLHERIFLGRAESWGNLADQGRDRQCAAPICGSRQSGVAHEQQAQEKKPGCPHLSSPCMNYREWCPQAGLEPARSCEQQILSLPVGRLGTQLVFLLALALPVSFGL